MKPCLSETVWERYAAACRPSLRRLAARFVGDDLADDIVQEAMLRAWRGRAFFRGSQDDFRRWLNVVLRSAACSYLRQQRGRRESELLVAEVHEWLLPSAPAADQALAPAAEQLAVERLRAAVARVPSAYRVVLLARAEGLDYRAIADLAGCGVGTVRSRLHRGKKHLARALLLAAHRGPAGQRPQETAR